jgi:peptidoglycan hydrolase-like protein with peptidoglycan-binding domain
VTWRVAQSLLTLRAEVDRKFPDRERTSDGTIGDESHALKGKGSDHNPWVKDSRGVGVVRALDVDAGPGKFPTRAEDTVGDIVSEVARLAGKAGHSALADGGYVIYEGKIASATSSPPWEWRTHTGDSHESHPHISVGRKVAAFDSKEPWGIAVAQEMPIRMPPASPAAFPNLQRGDHNEQVKLVQRFIWGSVRAKAMTVYGTFEDTTEKAVRGYQRMRGLPITGKVDQATWAPIRQALSI